jgi:hypothetical protein
VSYKLKNKILEKSFKESASPRVENIPESPKKSVKTPIKTPLKSKNDYLCIEEEKFTLSKDFLISQIILQMI